MSSTQFEIYLIDQDSTLELSNITNVNQIPNLRSKKIPKRHLIYTISCFLPLERFWTVEHAQKDKDYQLYQDKDIINNNQIVWWGDSDYSQLVASFTDSDINTSYLESINVRVDMRDVEQYLEEFFNINTIYELACVNIDFFDKKPKINLVVPQNKKDLKVFIEDSSLNLKKHMNETLPKSYLNKKSTLQ